MTFSSPGKVGEKNTQRMSWKLSWKPARSTFWIHLQRSAKPSYNHYHPSSLFFVWHGESNGLGYSYPYFRKYRKYPHVNGFFPLDLAGHGWREGDGRGILHLDAEPEADRSSQRRERMIPADSGLRMDMMDSISKFWSCMYIYIYLNILYYICKYNYI